MDASACISKSIQEPGQAGTEGGSPSAPCVYLPPQDQASALDDKTVLMVSVIRSLVLAVSGSFHYLPEPPQLPSLLGAFDWWHWAGLGGICGYHLLWLDKCLMGRGSTAEISIFELKSLL